MSPKLTMQSSVKPARRAGMFHGMNSDWTWATKARASSRVRGLRADSMLIRLPRRKACIVNLTLPAGGGNRKRRRIARPTFSERSMPGRDRSRARAADEGHHEEGGEEH